MMLVMGVLLAATTPPEMSLSEAQAELHALLEAPGFAQVVRPFGTCLQTATNQLTVGPAELSDAQKNEEAFVKKQLKACGADRTEAQLVQLVEQHDPSLSQERAVLRARIGMGTIRAGFEQNVKVKFGLFPVVAVPPESQNAPNH
jgi:hypothetical protein